MTKIRLKMVPRKTQVKRSAVRKAVAGLFDARRKAAGKKTTSRKNVTKTSVGRVKKAA